MTNYNVDKGQMNMKKVTIKDIAREAGVSTATVSYVINNRVDQKISEETKAKVLQIVNLYNYKPTSSAKSLTPSLTRTIAVYVGEFADGLGSYSEWRGLSMLRDGFAKEKYHLILQDKTNIKRLDNVDAIICHGTTVNFFRSIAELNFVPVIAVDLYVNDNLFFQINSNYRKVVDVAEANFGYDDFTIVMPDGLSPQVRGQLRRAYQTKAIKDLEHLKEYLLENIDRNIIVYGVELAKIAKLIKEDVVAFPIFTEDKVQTIIQCAKKAITRQDVSQKHFEV